MARNKSKGSRKDAAPAAAAEVEVAQSGLGFEDGLVLTTGILLVIAIALMAMNGY